jgi:hypothetical protein
VVVYLSLVAFFVSSRFKTRPNQQVLRHAVDVHIAYHTVDKKYISRFHMLSALTSLGCALRSSLSIEPSKRQGFFYLPQQ